MRGRETPCGAVRGLLPLLLLALGGPARAQSTGRCEVHPPFTPSFEPELEWAWTGGGVLPEHHQVMMTPVVVDVNGDGVPDVVFNAFAGPYSFQDGVLRALSGADGRELWTVTDPRYRVRGSASLAAGDLDGDGQVELCTVPESGQGLICFGHDGAFKFRTSGPANAWGGPSMADLDGDGTVELLEGNHVFDSTGALKWVGEDGPGGPRGSGPLSFAADVDLDGSLEVINGGSVYRADGSLKCHDLSLGGGLAGVGNFDGDPRAEIVVVAEGKVSLLDDDCRRLWTTPLPGGGQGGAPNIADLDGDGQAEIGVAGAQAYTVFSADGTVRWSRPTRDLSSSVTGSSTFDFEGDGKAEVIYADETRLRIYDGATGAVRFEVPHSSGTAYENPIVVDVDGDDNAELVVAANDYTGLGSFTGIRVFRDKHDGWVNTRRIWNQHAYSVTGVNDDGTIPAHPAPNWRTPGLNTFRSNSQGVGTSSAFAAPDVRIGSGPRAACEPGTGRVTLWASVANPGDAAASAGLKVAFYAGPPASGGTRLGVARVPGVLPAGGVAEVSLTIESAPGGEVEVWAVADDDGTGSGRETECHEDNNAAASRVSLACAPETSGIWEVTGALALPRLRHTATRLEDGRVLVAGGFNATAELYEPLFGTWLTTAPTLASHVGATATRLEDGRVLLVGGGLEQAPGGAAELYLPGFDVWRPAGVLSVPRFHHTATPLPGGEILVTGGEDREEGGKTLASAELYTPASDSWWPVLWELLTARAHHTATALPDGSVLIAGGRDGSGALLASAEVYDPVTRTFSPVGAMGSGRAHHTATLLPDGRVLVVGGAGADPLRSASAEVYDPATRTWSATGSMKTPRQWHTATLLPQGRVLVAGGYHPAMGILTSSELYDPSTHLWRDTGPLHVDRYGQTATLLEDGTVLAVGGASVHDPLPSERYVP